MGTTSWTFLLVGSFAALGAALSLGTLAALLRYRRTGTFPGADEPVDLSTGRLAGLWMRIVVGALIAIAGVVTIQRTGVW